MITVNLLSFDNWRANPAARPPFAARRRPTSSQSETPVIPVLIAGPRSECKALPLEWLLNPEKARNFPERVLARLIQLEAHELNVWLRDDYRQSFICLSLALKGNTEPFTVSSYQMYGLHPDKLFPAIVARRKAILGPEFHKACGKHDPIPQGAALTGAGDPAPATLRKPVQSVRKTDKRRAA